MIACDRCVAKNKNGQKVTTVAVLFKKYDGSSRQGRDMIRSEVELCEACITDFLKQFGKFKVAFMKEGDEPDPAEKESPDAK